MTKTSERACEPTLIVTNYQVTNVCSSCGFWSSLKLVCPVWGPDPVGVATERRFIYYAYLFTSDFRVVQQALSQLGAQ